MAFDSFIQVQPDSTGKQVDTDQVSTAAGIVIQRQRAAIVGSVDEALNTMLAIQQSQLSVMRAILALLSTQVPVAPAEEDFPPL